MEDISRRLRDVATAASISELRAEMWAMHARLIRWMVGTALASNGLLFIIAKCLH